jgi:hypothetical protein
MLEKVATHDIQDVSALFSLVDKCAKVAEGRAWHFLVAQALKGEKASPTLGLRPRAAPTARATTTTRTKTRRRLAATDRWPEHPPLQL